MSNHFRPIQGFEHHYEINELGEIRTIPRVTISKNNRIKKFTSVRIQTKEDHRSGYLVATLRRPNKKTSTQYVHRLVAKAFIPNPKNKPIVNHLDGNKLNARVENLEWVTYYENHIHAIQNSLIKLPHKNRSPIKDVCTGSIYPTMREAAERTGLKMYELRTLLRHPEKCNCLKRT